uniref:Uncharacterized protein n=1 Tax=Panagrolaimus sp. ES5 TaxID=591445 RepID=A0AC34GYK4_9BILA
MPRKAKVDESPHKRHHPETLSDTEIAEDEASQPAGKRRENDENRINGYSSDNDHGNQESKKVEKLVRRKYV